MSKRNGSSPTPPSVEELQRRARILEIANNQRQPSTANNNSQEEQTGNTQEILERTFRRYLDDREYTFHTRETTEPLDDATRRQRLLSVLERAMDILNNNDDEEDGAAEEHKQTSTSNHEADGNSDQDAQHS